MFFFLEAFTERERPSSPPEAINPSTPSVLAALERLLNEIRTRGVGEVGQ